MAKEAQLERIEDLPDDDVRRKEVSARFGRAALRAQGLENNIASLLAVTYFHDAGAVGSTLSDDQSEGLYEDLYSCTTGRLVKRLADAGWPEQYLDLCRLAVSERNRIVHRFQREHPDGFRDIETMQRMVDDSDATFQLFDRADQITLRILVSAVATTNAKSRGTTLTSEELAAEVDRLLNEAQQSG